MIQGFIFAIKSLNNRPGLSKKIIFVEYCIITKSALIVRDPIW